MNRDGDVQIGHIKWGPIGVTEIPDWVRSMKFAMTRPDGTGVGPVTLFDRDARPPQTQPDRPEPTSF